MKRSSVVMFGLLAIVVLLPVVVLAGGNGNPNPGVAPPQASPHGMSYAEWAAAWWQWSLPIPAAVNPMLTDGEVDAAIGQSGSVWFLAGSGGGPMSRTCTVPAGKSLFFPIVNWISIVPFDDPTEEGARAVANAFIDHIDALSCTVDGVPLGDLFAYRAESPTFPVTVGDIGWYPLGDYDIAMADGYWLMLAPLSVGQHTIHFTASGFIAGDEWPAGSVYYGWDCPISQDTAYTITVAPRRK